MNNIKKILYADGIEEYGIIDFNKLAIINPRIMPKTNIRSALIVLLPYRDGKTVVKDSYNMGLFARIKDYHSVYADIAERIMPKFKRIYGGEVFFFADHSPIHEKEAAAKCGLGFIGRNSLLINPKYGSFVFIGCFLFSEKLEEKVHRCNLSCDTCRNCVEACPTHAIAENGMLPDGCLSCISQKKAKTPEEKSVLKETRTVWGCDICQKACPYNKSAALSTIKEFREYTLENISAEIIEQMDDSVYRNFAFSYRPKKVIVENFLTAEGKHDIIK